MDSRKYPPPSTPPPPYYSVVNDNRQEYRSDQSANRNHPESREGRTPAFDQFINRYESEWFLEWLFGHRHIHLFS